VQPNHICGVRSKRPSKGDLPVGVNLFGYSDRCADQDSTGRRKDAPYGSACCGDHPALFPCDVPRTLPRSLDDPRTARFKIFVAMFPRCFCATRLKLGRHSLDDPTLEPVGAVLATARRIFVSLGPSSGRSPRPSEVFFQTKPCSNRPLTCLNSSYSVPSMQVTGAGRVFCLIRNRLTLLTLAHRIES
jgi:hypothetical protein